MSTSETPTPEAMRDVAWVLLLRGGLKDHPEARQLYTILKETQRELAAAKAEIERVNQKWRSDQFLMNGTFQILKEHKLMPGSDELIAASERFEKECAARSAKADVNPPND